MSQQRRNPLDISKVFPLRRLIIGSLHVVILGLLEITLVKIQGFKQNLRAIFSCTYLLFFLSALAFSQQILTISTFTFAENLYFLSFQSNLRTFFKRCIPQLPKSLYSSQQLFNSSVVDTEYVISNREHIKTRHQFIMKYYVWRLPLFQQSINTDRKYYISLLGFFTGILIFYLYYKVWIIEEHWVEQYGQDLPSYIHFPPLARMKYLS